jgi:hypothetical protein
MAMILELGTAHEMIRVTAEYSNAVLVAVLPYISNYAQKLDLPVPHPITTAHVLKCAVVPIRDAGATVLVAGDWVFWFRGGYVNGFQGPHSYFFLQNPEEAPRFYGKVGMSKDEAVELARKTITKLGVPLESVFAEQDPRVTGPVNVGTNIVPHFRIEWLDPRSTAAPAVDVEVDGETKRIQRLRIVSQTLRAPPPKTGADPLPAPASPKWPPVNPEYAWRLLPFVLHAVEDYSHALGLPIPKPLTTNQVARLFLDDNGGWPHCEIELTNGWRFIYRNSMVNGYYAPDNLFNSGTRPIRIREFTGKWNLTEVQATELVRHTLAKLNPPTNLVHMDFKPIIYKPSLPGIPRLSLSWHYEAQDDVQSKVEAELDMDKGELKSLYYDDKAYWNHPPPIDVPITLPAVPATNAPVPRQTGRPPATEAPSERLAFPVPLPR